MSNVMREIIERRLNFPEQKCCIKTKSFKEYKWFNCIYITFKKSDFPNFKYPELKEDKLFRGGLSFDYFESSFTDVDLHGGITFYEEVVYRESPNDIFVTIGADYQHLGDSEYNMADCGEMILDEEAVILAQNLNELHEAMAPKEL